MYEELRHFVIKYVRHINIIYIIFNRLPADMQVPDPRIRITRGKISVQIQVSVFDLKIPAGQVQVDPRVNSWRALILSLISLMGICGGG